MRSLMTRAVTLAIGLLFAAAAHAAPIDLTFEGLGPYPNGNNIAIGDAYNGGKDSAGYSGTNYGIGFSDNALLLCLNTSGTSCSNTSRGGVGDPNSQKGGLYFLSGSAAIMDVAAGFTTGFSFNYSAINSPGSVTVWSGLDGSGTALATLQIPITQSACVGFNAGYCPFFPIGVGFLGTAESVSFAGVGNHIVFDDITFGSTKPGMPVMPLPRSLPMFAAALLGLVIFARFRKPAAETTA